MDIIARNQKATGGLCGFKIELVRVSEIDSFPKQFNLKQISDITLLGAAEWVGLPFIAETPEPVEKVQIRGGQKYYKFTCTGDVILPNSERMSALRDYEDDALIVRYTDLNGKVYIMGSPTSPAVLELGDRRWGNKPSDKFVINLSINSVSLLPLLEKL